MPVPDDIRVEQLPIDKNVGWRVRWSALIHYLKQHAPCVYLPNYDSHCAAIIPQLPDQVIAVSVIHAHDDLYYEQLHRLGPYLNAAVTVSQALTEEVTRLEADLGPRIFHIPYGIDIPAHPVEKRVGDNIPLRIVYAGRLAQQYKRILEMPKIIAALKERQVPFELWLMGTGPEQQYLLESCAQWMFDGQVRFLGTLSNTYAQQVFALSDVFILTSDSEGLPISLLEAMGQGCVPVVTDIRSGMKQVVRDGENGFCVPVGDVSAFVERLTCLQRDPVLRRTMAASAYRTVRTGGYTISDMTRSYLTLFERAFDAVNTGVFFRPHGKILPPPDLKNIASWQNVLWTSSLQSLSRAGKNLLQLYVSRRWL